MGAVEKVITDKLPIWSSTVQPKSSAGRGSSSKRKLYGVKKLRELILDLAVHGLLVPQDPNDEPASALLEKIVSENERLIHNGTIRRQVSVPLLDAEIPFQLPSNWMWLRLGQVGRTQTGGTPKATHSHHYGSFMPFIKPGNIVDAKIEFYDRTGLSEDGAKLLGRTAPSDSILMVCIGTIGKCVRVDRAVSFNQQINSISPFRPIGKYVEKVLRARYFQRLAWELSSSTTLAILNKGKWEKIPVPLPPENEQHRIVDKVDELMALCDTLEQQQEESIEAHEALVEALLDALTSAADADAFKASWQRISAHFDVLFTTEHSINKLKEAILQLAVMGKLVRQDPNDEPASMLLKKITVEKERLVNEGKFKRHPLVAPIGRSMPMPPSWKEIVVQDFADVRLGSTPNRSEMSYWQGGIPWVSSGEVANCRIHNTKEKITPAGLDNSSANLIPKRSLLMAIIGQGKTRGQTALLEIDATTNQNVAALVFNEANVFPEYVWIWAQSKYSSHREDGHGGAQPALNGKKVRSFRFSLPPIAEQHRIVARVGELMPLCDQLLESLQQAQQTQIYLTDAVVENAL